MSTFSQRSFSGGEISPALFSRVDTAKYQTGLRSCRNFQVARHGGVQNRPGFQYLAEMKAGTTAGRLIPFVFSDEQSYVLEFGDNYVRIYQSGAQLGPGTVAAWADATAYIVGDLRSYNGVNYYCMRAHTSSLANDRPSTGTNQANYWYAMPAGVLEIPSPYAEEDLALVKYVQSADVLTLTHPDYPVYEVVRLSTVNWTFSQTAFRSSVTTPTGVSNNGAAALAQFTISSISIASSAVFTANTHGLSSGDVIQMRLQYSISPIPTSMSIVREFFSAVVTVLSVNTFTAVPVGASAAYDTSAYSTVTTDGSYFVKTGTSAAIIYTGAAYVVTAVSDDGIESEPSLVTGTSTVPASASAVTISWSAVSGVSRYNVYKKTGSLYGFIGSSDRLLFTDSGVVPDLTLTAPFSRADLFQAPGDYPSCPGYYQQRLLFGNSTNKPETVWGSRTGNFRSFSKREPLQDDDSVEFILAGRKVSAVKHLLDLGKLIVFTSSGEYAVNGDGSGALTPTNVNARQYSNYGCNDMAPIQIGNNALYVQARGSIVRDLAFDFAVDGYKGNDLTIFANHLFEGYTLVDWSYAQVPHSIIWAVRNDGAMLGLTYVPEHQVWGWHKHDTDGTFENVCVIPEVDEDAVYAIVARSIDGSTVRYVERMNSRRVSDIVDSVFSDSALTYDGRNTGDTTMTLSGGSTWAVNETLDLNASVATFAGAASDVGNAVHFSSGGVTYRARIVTADTTTHCYVRVDKDIPVALRGVATTTWSMAVDTLAGLEHLEGKAVSVLGDGNVVANPNNSSYPVVTVTSGSITLSEPYAVLHVGLPYLSDLQTLDIDTVNGESLVDKKKLVNKVTVKLESSRGLWAGAAEPADEATAPLQGLRELKQREAEGYDEPIELATREEEIVITSEWNSSGRVFLRQTDPLPLSVLSVHPAGVNPSRG